MSEEAEAREDEGILTRVSKSWEKNYVFSWLDVNVEREDQRGPFRKTLWLLFLSLKVISDSLWPDGLQHSRLLCPPLSPSVCSSSHPLRKVMSPNHLILCCLLLLLPSIFPSIRVFSYESVLCIRWPKYCSFSFSIIPFNEYLGLISFRIDWFDFLAVQGILKSPLHHHNPKASILQCLVFFRH